LHRDDKEMKRYLMGAVGAAIIAMPATAYASETYIGVSGGIAIPSDSANEGQFDAAVPATADWGAIPAGTSLGWDTEFDNGWTLSGQVGVKLDSGLRAELEVAYTKYNVATHSGLAAGGAVIDGVDVAVLTRGAPSASNPTVGQVIADGQGSVDSLGAFANAYYDFNAGGTFQPYIGAGIGYQRVNVEFMPSGVPVTDDSDSGLAWQAMAGASFAVSDTIDLFAQYTYRDSFDRAEVALDLLPATLGVESRQSLVTAGFRLKLGN